MEKNTCPYCGTILVEEYNIEENICDDCEHAKNYRMSKEQIKRELECSINFGYTNYDVDEYGNKYVSYYAGSFMQFDPCGRYHHLFSPNGITSICEDFWEDFEEVVKELGYEMESGVGDPCAIFLCKYSNDEEDYDIDEA